MLTKINIKIKNTLSEILYIELAFLKTDLLTYFDYVR